MTLRTQTEFAHPSAHPSTGCVARPADGFRSRSRLLPRLLMAVVLGTLGLAATGCQSNITDDDIEVVTLEEVRGLVGPAGESGRRNRGGVVLIDARPPSAYESGHIPRAANLRLEQFPRESRKQERYEEAEHLIVYGENPGSASARGLTKRLMEIGYKQARLFPGGIEAWRRAGLPVEGEPAAAEPVAP